jgi:hypothetical protein
MWHLLEKGRVSPEELHCLSLNWDLCILCTFIYIAYLQTDASFSVYCTIFSTGFYSPYRTLAFLNGLLDPQTFGRTPLLGDQSNTRPLPKHRTTQHRNTQTYIHAPSMIRICDLNVQAAVDSTCLRPLGY